MVNVANDEAARRLAKHYRRTDRLDEVRRVLHAYEKPFLEIAKQADTLFAQSFLEQVREDYIEHGLKEDAERIAMISKQKAQEQTLAALQKDKDIVGIFGTNVFSAQGANQAVVNAGLVGAIKIASWDATITNIENLKKGVIDLVLAQKPGEMGSLGVEWLYKYLTQKVQVPKKVIPGFEFFTKDNVNDPNMQQYIYQ